MRLDRIFCTNTLCPQFIDTEYLGHTFSDHNPLRVRLGIGRDIPPIPTWRLQPNSLTDPVFKDQLKTHIIDYFVTNEGTATNAITEWETFKVMIRGFCMGKTVGLRRELERTLDNTEHQIRLLEKEVVLDHAKRKNLESCRTEHSELIEKLRFHNY